MKVHILLNIVYNLETGFGERNHGIKYTRQYGYGLYRFIQHVPLCMAIMKWHSRIKHFIE